MYTPQTWHDLPTTDTPIDKDALDHMEAGIVAAHDLADDAQTTADAAAVDAAQALAKLLRVSDEGTLLTQRSLIDFIGAGVTVGDSGTKTVVNIPGGGGGGVTWARSSLAGAALLGSATSWTPIDTSKDVDYTGLAAGDWVDLSLANVDLTALTAATVAQDDFARTAAVNSFGNDLTGGSYTYIGSDWTLDGSDALAGNAAGDHVWLRDAGSTAYTVDFTIGGSPMGSAADAGPVVRVVDASNWVLVHLKTALIYTQAGGSYDGGTAMTAVTWAAGDVCRVVVTTADIKVYRQAGGVGSFTLLGTKTTTALNTATKVGYRKNGSTGSGNVKVRDFVLTTVPPPSLLDQTFLDIVTVVSGSPVNSIYAAAAAPTGSSGPGALTIPAGRWTGGLRAHYQIQSSDLSSGAAKFRAIYRSPGLGARTVTRAQMLVAKV